MFKSHKTNKTVANLVTIFHFLWTFLIFGGTFFMLFYHWYAPFHIAVMSITALSNLPLKGTCPFTHLEERLRKKIDPGYSNQNSFLTTYFNKTFRTHFKVRTMNTAMILFYIASYYAAIKLMLCR